MCRSIAAWVNREDFITRINMLWHLFHPVPEGSSLVSLKAPSTLTRAPRACFRRLPLCCHHGADHDLGDTSSVALVHDIAVTRRQLDAHTYR